MFNHAPENYKCPLCTITNGGNNDFPWATQADIVYKDDLVLAMINTKFVGDNPGHVIVIPIEHYENIYDIPKEVAHRIFDVSQKISLALKEVRKCDGVMIQQNNEPASNQHAFHYHQHIVPRFEGDQFEENIKKDRVAEPSERLPYAETLKKYLRSH